MTTTNHSAPYWRLSGFYFFYFATLGALVPYWSLYLRSLGFADVQIGELVAIIAGTKIIAPNVWGWIADHRGHRMTIVRLASLGAVVCFTGVFFGTGYWWLALVMTGFSFFWNASLPQFEATTMNHLGERTQRYSIVRLWGSIGFIITVVGLGYLFDWRGVGWLPVVLLALYAGIWVASLLVPERAAGHLPLDHRPLREVLGRREVVALLLACFLAQASHGPYYTFYSIYLADHGYRANLIGGLWAWGVVAEIGVFLFMHRLLPRFGPRRLLLAALALTALRWCLIALFVAHPSVLVLAQILHAASFGVVHVVSIYLIHLYFTGRHQGRGQALYSSLSFGAGGAVGSLYAGYLWGSAGAIPTYLTAAGLALLGWVVAWYGIRREGAAPVP
jgi:PPP family 3-phenylpropionic acid transporter